MADGSRGMVKVQFGCGGNRPAGWLNHDIEVDIAKRLPYADDAVDRVFCEHCVEHVTSAQMLDFMLECRRILKPCGIVRLVFPDVLRIKALATEGYAAWLEARGHQRRLATPAATAVMNIGRGHGHCQLLTRDTVEAALEACGLRIKAHNDPEFEGVAGHWRAIGSAFNDIESQTVEAIK